MFQFTSFISLLYLLLFSSMDWGQIGHRVVGEVAEQYLTVRAQKAIDDLLDGASLASVSTFADEIKSDPKYRSLSSWHYVNLPLSMTYAASKKNSKGDVVMAINICIDKIKDQRESKKEKSFYLKLLVHFIGDLHQPMHLGRKKDRGGNNIRLKWLGKSTNLHRLWDSNLIKSYGMRYVELTHDLDQLSCRERNQIKKQPIAVWIAETQVLTKMIYENTPANSKLEYPYQYRYMPVVKMQLQKGGLRLAATLNTLFK